jgi:hypothetical protein
MQWAHGPLGPLGPLGPWAPWPTKIFENPKIIKNQRKSAKIHNKQCKPTKKTNNCQITATWLIMSTEHKARSTKRRVQSIPLVLQHSSLYRMVRDLWSCNPKIDPVLKRRQSLEVKRKISLCYKTDSLRHTIALALQNVLIVGQSHNLGRRRQQIVCPILSNNSVKFHEHP